MRIVLFYHSLLSDWNHGNAHFLRGVVSELLAGGHRVLVYEPYHGWSLHHLLREHGTAPLAGFRRAYPQLRSIRYELDSLDLDRVLDHADLVLVHEWNDRALVERIGRHRDRAGRYTLLFHDTHHRSVTEPEALGGYDLAHYDGVLAFGEAVREVYLRRGWAERVWTWHEAADTRVFRPLPESQRPEDLVWVGNWGDDERTAELAEFLLHPVRALGLRARVYGVRYPEAARRTLERAGISHGGWLPNYEVPAVFARFRATVHIPRRPYTLALPGIPTIRVFEALACGIPLVCSRWDDVEGLFAPGRDYLLARSGTEMASCLGAVLSDPAMARELSRHGLATIRARHTCRHRVDELLAIHRQLACGTGRGAGVLAP